VSISPPPEYALLLDAIAPEQGPPRELYGWDDARWDRILRLAEWHRLSPLLFRHLSDRRAAPARVVDALEERARATPAGPVGLPVDVVTLRVGVEAAGRVDQDWLRPESRAQCGRGPPLDSPGPVIPEI